MHESGLPKGGGKERGARDLLAAFQNSEDGEEFLAAVLAG
jgi:hypothetical protein